MVEPEQIDSALSLYSAVYQETEPITLSQQRIAHRAAIVAVLKWARDIQNEGTPHD